MRRGLGEEDYNLEVRVSERYRSDDVFELARLYNEKYLPLKDRTQAEDGQSVIQLNMEEVSRILPEDDES
jgi:hypothetical protein